METTTAVALTGAGGVVVGAAITALVTLMSSRHTVRQRRREQLIERAFEMARTEFHAQLKEARMRTSQGIPTDMPAFAHYLTFNLILANHLTDLDEVTKLDADSITRALTHASEVTAEAMERRTRNALARVQAWNRAAGHIEPTATNDRGTK